MESYPLFYVIDAKTTYNMLLGRPWIHQNGVVSSTLHQCFKYYKNGQVKTIVADSKPFSIAEAHFIDAKFYLESAFVEDVQYVFDEMKQSNEKNLASSSSEENEISQGLKNLILPLTNLDDSKVFKPPLKVFVRPMEEPLVEHGDLPSHRVKGFDPNTYRLFVKAGYKKEDVSKLAFKTEEPIEKKLTKTH